MKNILKFIGKSLLGILLFLLAYLGIGWILAQITIDEKGTNDDDITIYIKSNGVHTDIVIPAKSDFYNWTAQLPYEHAEQVDSSFKWIGIGWGDKGFYLETPEWADLKASVAFKAAFGLSTTAMHTTYYNSIKIDENCKMTRISKEQYQLLVDYIRKSFKTNNQGQFIHIRTTANYGKTDAFYEAHGKYSLFKTCNSWANTALKESGQKAALWTAFDTGILSKY